EPDVMAREAAWVQETLGTALAYIDINMGCPARKIVTKGDGSALMGNPPLASAIVSAVKGAVECPVTAKFRRGLSSPCETAPEFARVLEQAGVDAIAVHGRFTDQLYRGTASWETIKRVKEAVQIPVVGNGDIGSGSDAVAMQRETGCDAVMIARAAQGNPWIFGQVQAALTGNPEPARPTAAERIAMARKHARLLDSGDRHQMVRMRKHAMWYIAGLPGAARARALITDCSTLEEFESVFDDLAARLDEHTPSGA
ncbi:MAG: tRNA-dihydrouridine synthase, partial [Eggerthellaceae bacterium]|nr:tRNA-dihydrouridine synthase [Eggerthellaceae bacterium]